MGEVSRLIHWLTEKGHFTPAQIQELILYVENSPMPPFPEDKQG